jgi:tyrosine-protein phosphatase non-receptor type 4
MDLVVQNLDLVEKDYFGLAVKGARLSTKKEKGRSEMSPVEEYPPVIWLDPVKKLKKQWSGSGPFELELRVKYFVSDPSDLQEEYTRYLFFLQCKKDLISGRLPCPFDIACMLGSYTIQSELGDYDPEEHVDGYASAFKLYKRPSPGYEQKVEEIHRGLKGMPPDAAERLFLERTCKLDYYGVNLFHGKDHQEIPLRLSATALGVAVFDEETKINTFPWNDIQKITYRRKKFLIEIRADKGRDRADALVTYTLSSLEACQVLWENCIDHHIFFKKDRPEVPPRQRILGRGSKHRFSGRTRKQALLEDKDRLRIKRSTSPGEYFERIQTVKVPLKALGPPKATAKVNGKVLDDSVISRPNVLSSHVTVRRTNTINGPHKEASPLPGLLRPEVERMRRISDEPRVFRFSPIPQPDGGNSDYSGPEEMYDPHQAAMDDALFHYHGYTADELATEGLMAVKLTADAQGRFGFTVTVGGLEQMQSLVIVSQIIPELPASLAMPTVAKGDQILHINGTSLYNVKHSEVISLIKEAGQSESREMLLIIKPSDLSRVEGPSQDFQIASEHHGEQLQRSLQSLKRGLRSGQLLRQFDQLYRRRPGMDMSECKLPHNMPKNRYKDVFAYDVTRVKLKEGQDYINANYINMEIPKSGLLLRYIASQGPLRHTCTDFWQMIWEQGSTLVIMLTTTTEGGKSKCAKYWPHLQKSVAYGPFEIYCLSEEEITANSATCRHFRLRHLLQRQERRILHLQYTAWPDHGVPDKTDDFLNFMQQVRKDRKDLDEPVVVHCSAGVGRTGVLIAVETAINTMEILEPVDLMETVRRMRDQRGMMVQSPAQFQFVAECILQAYSEGYCEFEPM